MVADRRVKHSNADLTARESDSCRSHTPSVPSSAYTRFMDFHLSRASLSIGALDVLRGTQLHHQFAPHMHEFFAIGVIDDGAARVRYRGCNASARAGALVTISAGEMHTGGPAADCGWSYRMIYPQRGLLRLALEDTIDEDESLLFRSPFIDDRDVRDAFDRMYGALLGGNCDLAAEEAVLHFLRLLALKHSSRPPRAPLGARRKAVVETARDYLEAHFAERVHLSRAGRCVRRKPLPFDSRLSPRDRRAAARLPQAAPRCARHGDAPRRRTRGEHRVCMRLQRSEPFDARVQEHVWLSAGRVPAGAAQLASCHPERSEGPAIPWCTCRSLGRVASSG